MQLVCAQTRPRFIFSSERVLENGVRTHVKGATPGPRKQTSAGQGPINLSVTTETGESWEGLLRWCVSQREVTRDGLTHRQAEEMRECRIIVMTVRSRTMTFRSRTMTIRRRMAGLPATCEVAPLTPREKSPLPEAQRSVEPATLHHIGQRAQHTTH